MAGRGNVREVGEIKAKNRTIRATELHAAPESFVTGWSGNFVQRARELLRGAEGFQGLPAEFEADPRVQKTSGGGTAVHLRQQFKSIPIMHGAQTVRFAPDGTAQDAQGTTFTIAEDLPVQPRITVQLAVSAAAQHVNESNEGLLGEEDDFGNALQPPHVDLTNFEPTVVAAFVDTPQQATVLAPGPFGHPIRANLVWYPEEPTLRLGWEVLLTMPQGAGQYRVVVDANSGAILFSRQLVDMLMGQGNVYQVDGESRTMTPFPRPWSDYSDVVDTGSLPPGVPANPSHWVDDNRRDTFGNCVRAQLADTAAPLAGSANGASILFNASSATGDDQKVLNMFYFNSYLHDLFYLLGFREEDGNFQQMGVGGISGDPVDARAHSGAVWGTANMLTPPDGTSPTMNMGLVESTGRHTAFDASVVFHEYMHGVTNRLVGGPLNTQALQEPQSKAMGEGWGDYLACVLTKRAAVGTWVTGKPNGIRSAPYDANYSGHFGQIGQGIYTAPHRVGEIWCAALVEMNRQLNTRLTTPRGQRLGLQLVVDALKIAPANPNMLEMRDSILTALGHKRDTQGGLNQADYGQASSGIWAAFAKFGMGARAMSNGAKFFDVAGDFSVPGGVMLPPSGGTPVSPGGGPRSTDPSTGTAGAGIVRVQTSRSLAIPDGDPAGVSSVLRVDLTGSITGLTVHLDITHKYVADLRVTVTAPGGHNIVLHDFAYSEDPDLVRDYTADTTPALAALVGQSARGDWTLNVSDQSPLEVGVVRGWGLAINVGGGSALAGFAGLADSAGVATLAGDATRLLGELSRTLNQLLLVLGPR